MSKTNQNNTVQETRLLSRTTVTMSPIYFSHNQAQALQQISLLSPLPLDQHTRNGPYTTTTATLLTIDTYSCAPQQHHRGDVKLVYNDQNEGLLDSPEDRDCYYDQDSFYSPGLAQHAVIDSSKLPPIPTYHESQMAYHPNGVKRLPHFHPQKFSKRLRTIINQRRRPLPLSLHIEPQPKSYFSPSPTPCQTESTSTSSPSPTSSTNSLIQAILRILPHGYTQVHGHPHHSHRRHHHVENGTTEYIVNQEEEYDDGGSFWRDVDHRVIIMGIVGLFLLAFGLGAWAMAMYTS